MAGWRPCFVPLLPLLLYCVRERAVKKKKQSTKGLGCSATEPEDPGLILAVAAAL